MLFHLDMDASSSSGIQALPQVVQSDGAWMVRVPQGNGRVQEYRCASEEQARHLLAVLAPPAP
jgi:hypothetical protein